MLMPKRVKYRKQMRGRMKGMAQRGAEVHFGDFGLQALEPGWVSARQIEAARRAILFEVGGGLPEEAAKEALRLASYKLSIKSKIVPRYGIVGGEK